MFAWHPLTWWTAAFVVATAIAHLGWWALQRDGIQDLRLWRPATRAARFAYLLGIPIVAIALRIPTPDTLGLRSPDQPLSGWLITLVAISATWGLGVLVHVWRGGAWRLPALERIGRSSLDALALEGHWAFTRAAALAVGIPARGGPDVDVGRSLLLAAGLLLLEAVALRDVWAAVEGRRPERAHRLATLAFLSFGVYTSTGSSVCAWVAIAAVLWLWTGRQPLSDDRRTGAGQTVEARDVSVYPSGS